MISIVKPGKENAQLLANIGRISFIESHGSSAPVEDINKYVKEKFEKNVITEELDNPENIYHLAYYNNQPVGYSKIILTSLHPGIRLKNVTKLERLYLLKEFYHLNVGGELLQSNIELSGNNGQLGMWLFVWKENDRAVRFYKKKGFEIIGDYDFKLTASHSNPNYHMLLKY